MDALHDNESWQIYLAQAYVSIGLALNAQGKPRDALENYEKARAIREYVATSDSGNTLKTVMLAATYNLVGAALFKMNQYVDAVKAFQSALQINEGVLSQHSGEILWRETSAIAQVGIGAALLEQHDLTNALQYYQQAILTFEQLMSVDSNVIIIQQELATAYLGISGVLIDQERLDEAIGYLMKCRVIDESIATKNPNDSVAKYHLARSDIHLAQVFVGRKETNKALELFLEGRKIVKLLPAPDEVGRQMEIVLLNEQISDLLVGSNRKSDAVGYLRDSVAIFEMMARTRGDEEVWKIGLSGLSDTLCEIGELILSQEKADDALDSFNACLEVRKQMASAPMSNDDAAQYRVAEAKAKIADALFKQGNLSRALQAYGEALEILQGRGDPNEDRWQEDMEAVNTSIGAVLENQNDLGGALDHYSKGTEILKLLAKSNAGGGRVWNEELAASYVRLGNVLGKQGKTSEALDAFIESLDVDAHMIEQNSLSVSSQVDLIVHVWRHAMPSDKLQDVVMRLASVLLQLKFINKLSNDQAAWLSEVERRLTQTNP